MRYLTRLLVAFVLMLQHNVSFACAVCFGDPNSKMMQGMNSAIFVLLGFIGFLLVSFGAHADNIINDKIIKIFEYFISYPL